MLLIVRVGSILLDIIWGIFAILNLCGHPYVTDHQLIQYGVSLAVMNIFAKIAAKLGRE